jgi:hypothetical protein
MFSFYCRPFLIAFRFESSHRINLAFLNSVSQISHSYFLHIRILRKPRTAEEDSRRLVESESSRPNTISITACLSTVVASTVEIEMATHIPKPLVPTRLTSEELSFLTKEPGYSTLLINSYELTARVPLSHPLQWSREKKPCAGFGMLDRLPREFQNQLFSTLPISSLMDLRRTNSHAKQSIEQWQPFRTAMAEGGTLICALLLTGAGHTWTMQQVAEIIFTSACEICGAHGEIIHLLKLRRCCFRCLSQERELLVVPEAYARECMSIEMDELAALPAKMISVSQKSFWGGPAGERTWMFNYSDLMDVLRKLPRAQNRKVQREQCLPMELTSELLSSEKRSPPRRRRPAIQDRREQPSLRLSAEEVTPMETDYWQHASAIRMPPKSRTTTLVRDGRLVTKTTATQAVHCAGCAYYWNYHSPMPYQYHKLYPHQKGQNNSPFLQHLSKCPYAKAQWLWVYNPTCPARLEHIIGRASDKHLQLQTRTGGAPGPAENARFEEIPAHLKYLASQNAADSASSVPKPTWPTLKRKRDHEDDNEEVERAIKRDTERIFQKIKKRDGEKASTQPDQYWDSIISEEAASQANWACARRSNGKVSVFGAPPVIGNLRRGLTSVMMEKHHRKIHKIGTRMPVPGLINMYL